MTELLPSLPDSPFHTSFLSKKNLSRPALYITLIALFQSLTVYFLIARENGTIANSKTSTRPCKPLNGNSGKRESFSEKHLSNVHYWDSHITKQHNWDSILTKDILVPGPHWPPVPGHQSLCCADGWAPSNDRILCLVPRTQEAQTSLWNQCSSCSFDSQNKGKGLWQAGDSKNGGIIAKPQFLCRCVQPSESCSFHWWIPAALSVELRGLGNVWWIFWWCSVGKHE